MSELRLDELERAHADANTVEMAPDFRRSHLKAVREHLGKGETVLIHWAADAFRERNQLVVER